MLLQSIHFQLSASQIVPMEKDDILLSESLQVTHGFSKKPLISSSLNAKLGLFPVSKITFNKKDEILFNQSMCFS